MNARTIAVGSTNICAEIEGKLAGAGVTHFSSHQVRVMETMMERQRDVVMVAVGKDKGKTLSYAVVVANYIAMNEKACFGKEKVMVNDWCSADFGKEIDRDVYEGKELPRETEYEVKDSEGTLVGIKTRQVEENVARLTSDMERIGSWLYDDINVAGEIKFDGTAGSNLIAIILLSNEASMEEMKELMDYFLMDCVRNNVLVSPKNCSVYSHYNMLKKANVWITCLDTLFKMTEKGMDLRNMKWFVMDHANSVCFKEGNIFLQRLMAKIEMNNSDWQLTVAARKLNQDQMGFIKKLCRRNFLFENFDVEENEMASRVGESVKIPKFFSRSE